MTKRDEEADNVLDAIRFHACRSAARGSVRGMPVWLADQTFRARAIRRLLGEGRIETYCRSDDTSDWWYREPGFESRGGG